LSCRSTCHGGAKTTATFRRCLVERVSSLLGGHRRLRHRRRSYNAPRQSRSRTGRSCSSSLASCVSSRCDGARRCLVTSKESEVSKTIRERQEVDVIRASKEPTHLPSTTKDRRRTLLPSCARATCDPPVGARPWRTLFFCRAQVFFSRRSLRRRSLRTFRAASSRSTPAIDCYDDDVSLATQSRVDHQVAVPIYGPR